MDLRQAIKSPGSVVHRSRSVVCGGFCSDHCVGGASAELSQVPRDRSPSEPVTSLIKVLDIARPAVILGLQSQSLLSLCPMTSHPLTHRRRMKRFPMNITNAPRQPPNTVTRVWPE
ncbi:unnamed protein product [Arctogadus glacialis]